MGVLKKSVSFDVETFQEVEAEAKLSHVSKSAALNEAAELWLTRRRGLRAVAHWEAEHGRLTSAELAEADHVLDSAQG